MSNFFCYPKCVTHFLLLLLLLLLLLRLFTRADDKIPHENRLLSFSASDWLLVIKGCIIGKTGIEFHWLGPAIKLKKRLVRGDPGINRLDRIAKQHDIDYSKAKNLLDNVINSARAFRLAYHFSIVSHLCDFSFQSLTTCLRSRTTYVSS